MTILSGINLSKSYGALDVLEGINITIEKGDRIGLVGPNGEGKSTLLKIIAGQEEPSEGKIRRKQRLTIGYLPQDPPEPGDQTLWEVMLEPFAELRQQEASLQQLMAQISNGDHSPETMVRYGALEEEFRLAGGYDYEVEIRKTLRGLSFTVEQEQQLLCQFSGGQRARAYLGRLLLAKPELLLLDEPTNHLDLAALEWLESVLSNWPGALIVVAHDRYFLDKLSNRIWEIAFSFLETYRGNYSHYRQQRQERLALWRRRWEEQQAYIAKTEDFVRRNLAGQRTKEAQGRRTRLERFLQEDAISRPREQEQIKFKLQARLRGGDVVLTTRDLVIGYTDDQPLFRVPNLELRRGERAALIGANGSGKTTFLRTILGEIPLLAGNIRRGVGVRTGYMAQMHSTLDPRKSVLDTLLATKNIPIEQARSLLARFLFRGDDAFRRVGQLSGGQRSRLVLAQLTVQRANFLLLDEPTNHLDLDSQEILQNVLQEFDGTILLVTHDRYLVEALATQVWWLEDGRLYVSHGGYTAYLAQKERQQADRTVARQERKGNQYYEERKTLRRQRQAAMKQAARVADMEAHIERLEVKLSAVGEAISRAGQAMDMEKVQVLGEEYRLLEKRLEQLVSEWEELSQ